MSAALLLALAAAPAAPPANADISVPPGFSVKLAADNAVASDIYTMTIDEAGRVLVAGRGYVRVLVDDDRDGVADRAVDLIDGLKEGPMGLFAEGESLYVVVEGGLHRYRGYDGKSKLKDRDTLIKLKTTGEHDTHAVRRGPDGWLYLLCGNMAGVNAKTVTSQRSPVKEPVAGTLLRISPDEKEIEVVADGFRNAYSFDFNLDGEPFTYDSDNERCVGLPWYEPCRFYHVVPGGNYGWRSPQLGQFWRKPPYFVDCVAPICYLGRGSPTGVACYRHTHFPEKYRGGFFLADWTFGRIHFVPLTPKQSTYAGEPQVFAEAIGTSGFAPTALAVHPKTGELFVSIGGRGTRGGVYRISHDKSPPGKPIEIASRSLEWRVPNDGKRWLADCTGDDARLRRNTLELMLRAGVKFGWSPKLKDAVKPNLSHTDPLVRMAAARTLKPLIVPVGLDLDMQTQLMVALMEVNEEPRESLKTALAVLGDKATKRDVKLQALRIIQLALGDLTAKESVGSVFEGYTLRKTPTEQQRKGIEAACTNLWTGDNTNLEREVFRTLAGIQAADTQFPRWALRQITRDTDPVEDVAYLAVLARLGSENAYAPDIGDALLDLERKVVAQKVPRDTFWPLRLAEVAAALQERYPAIRTRVSGQERFGQPEDFLWVKPLGIEPRDAIESFIVTAAKTKDYAWTPGQIALFSALRGPIRRHHLEALSLWEKPELRDAILKVLPPDVEDQPKFTVGLSSLDPEVVRISAAALLPMPRPKQVLPVPRAEDLVELLSAIKALKRLAPEDKAARESVAALLYRRTGTDLGTDQKPWIEWLSKHHPQVIKALAVNDGFDAAAWKKREAGIAWDKGDAERGRAVFTKASCAACHDGGRALGPSLLGITKRFGRDDLLTAILQPSKDVSARYRPVRITTTDEKVYIGMLIYEATDGVILQTNADTAVRIAGANIVSKRPVEASIMPAGLLDKLSDAEIADLLAYLKTLEEPKPK